MTKFYLYAAVALAAFTPLTAQACGCGCGIFDVGTGSMLPTGDGGTVWLEYAYANQSENWSGTSRAPKENNDDRQIRTHFITAGGQYMFNRSWGVEGQVPYWNRVFKTTNEDNADMIGLHRAAIGDVRIKGVYSGFSDDMSTGVTFGLKLPTGPFNTPGFDRDTQIGSGSTDLLLGAYHMGALTEDALFDWFVNGQWQRAVSIQDHYRPGDEFDVATGVYFNGVDIGGSGKLTPLFQLIGATRLRDAGDNAKPNDTGYTKLLLSPGVEYTVDQVKLYGDVEFPVYQNMNGNQLSAPVQFKFIVGYTF